MSEIHESLYGYLHAFEEGRGEDVAMLGQQMIDDLGSVGALIQVASAVVSLRHHPGTSFPVLAQVVAAQRGGYELDASSITGGTIANEVLDVLEDLRGGGGLSDESRRVLAQYDNRPGSSAVIGMLCNMIYLLLADLELQDMHVEGGRRSMRSAVGYALEAARVRANGEAAPNPFDMKYNDRDA
ncbi:hypothetical protein [Nocardioides massiliensis]|uniref:Uncharacterized protein n=1 Tax=Nocardioides massiliensis TaxID=1325935 RepID=A0ABT9NQX7_9ACTN|nr:hypothetical protein [Nocardioides massiliensis]MDP9822783.1 hypothetical protein [Nocardioides massiliensis]